MKIQKIAVSGFRGFREKVELRIAPGFTVIDGRNGVGKSTLFDAVEFALTGEISKYGDQKANGEDVHDYVWWQGEGEPPEERFVEVAFENGQEAVVVRRTPVEDPPDALLERVACQMVDIGAAPPEPLAQLCASSIIRDENIASLSLDLSETQRYAKLRQAIGASDADIWVERGKKLSGIAKKASEAAKLEVSAANTAISEATRQLDEARASISPDAAISEASDTVVRLLDVSRSAPDQLASIARKFVAKAERELAALHGMLDEWDRHKNNAEERTLLSGRLEKSREARIVAEKNLLDLGDEPEKSSSDATTSLINSVQELRQIAEQISPIDGHCPLCAAEHDQASFASGFERAGEIIRQRGAAESERAAQLAKRRDAFRIARLALQESQEAEGQLNNELQQKDSLYAEYLQRFDELQLAPDTSRSEVEATIEARSREYSQVREALSVLETAENNRQIEIGTARLENANRRLAQAQEVAGKARRTESIAASLFDAARRAGSETLDRRLDRVLPLMAELYGRLRPHPVWQDIEYSIRGDLRRFLSLQVGDGLNPQFLFSSGQRRATGLAFLLSINLSLAWSNWQSVLLDDPVQHVDDFRTVNLAEVLAQLVTVGRQVVIAVEDPALAELLARRMPVAKSGDASRVTLGIGSTGSATVLSEVAPQPMLEQVLAA